MNEETNENVDKTYTDPVTGKFIPGNPGGGRPKGTFSLKTKIIQQLESNPDQLQEVLDHIIKEERALLFQMIDGRPKQDHEVDIGFKPIPILGGITNEIKDNENERAD